MEETPRQRAERLWGMPCYCHPYEDVPCMVCQLTRELQQAVGAETERCEKILWQVAYAEDPKRREEAQYAIRGGDR